MKGLEFLGSLPEWRGQGGFSTDNVRRVLKYLGNPQDKVQSVHVAGTNGKGSVSAAVASILGAAGSKVGLTISPHLESLNERVVLDGVSVSDEMLEAAASEVTRACATTCTTLSFFEAITACAFLTFHWEKVDWMVLETGLGGRLDATNVISKPDACCIVTIDRDHEDLLGDTLEKIAAEKAGIIKRGSAVISGPTARGALSVIEAEANRCGAAHYRFGSEFACEEIGEEDSYTCLYTSDAGSRINFKPSLNGRHQSANMAVAMRAAQSLGVGEDFCKRGVENVFWPARLESVHYRGREFIFDCAHNPAGVRGLCAYLASKKLTELTVCFGVLDTKNWKEMISLLKPYVREWVILKPQSSRAIDSVKLAEYLSSIEIIAKPFDDRYEDCLSYLLSVAEAERPILITGSMYMVGALRAMTGIGINKLWSRSS